MQHSSHSDCWAVAVQDLEQHPVAEWVFLNLAERWAGAVDDSLRHTAMKRVLRFWSMQVPTRLINMALPDPTGMQELQW